MASHDTTAVAGSGDDRAQQTGGTTDQSPIPEAGAPALPVVPGAVEAAPLTGALGPADAGPAAAGAGPLGARLVEAAAATEEPPRGRKGKLKSKRRLRDRLRRDWPLLVMVAPAALLLLVFHYLPTLGNVIAFQDYSPWNGDSPIEALFNSPFIGFTNFQILFAEPQFWDALINTLTITLFQLIFFFPIPIFLAILLNGVLSRRVRGFIQSVVYLPHFFSWVLVVTFFMQMFGGAGLLAEEMRGAGLEPLNIMSNPDTFIFLVTAEAVWKDAGWGMIVFLAALTAIDPNLYEASAADGAGRWRRLWHVTLPGLRPIIVLLLILRLGDALSVGFEQYILQRNSVGADAAEVLDTYVYYHAIVPQQYGEGAAAGLFKGVVGLILILVANKIAHKLGEQGVYSKS